ncbi:MAG TPA: alanine--glyoxylate aminotransferase family protein [Candidatus Acidoferrales bacterium]|nr:alanine--glyoxylate aminotransferase family protein [Candidatus Acidoferrales bacterium]
MWNKAREPIRLLMTPGPVEVSPRVLSALARPQVYHYYQGFVDFFQETTEKLQKVFQTSNDVLLLQGEGVLGLEAAIVNTVNPGDKILVLDNGPFGKWFGLYVENAGGKPVYLTGPNNEAIDPTKLKEKLDTEKDIKAMTVVHCETPAGILNPIRELCPIAKKRGILTIVDTVASLAGVDVKPDQWGIDFCCGASQKALSSSPGLTMLAVSKDGWEAIDHKKNPIKNSYVSIPDYRDTWLKDKRFPFTPMVSEVYALSEAADELLEEGLDNSFKRHQMVGDACRDGAERIGFKLWAKRREDASNTVTAIQVPSSTTDTEIVNHMVEKYGILIGGGYKETKGELLRIGHMGYQATLTNVLTTLTALEGTLTDLKKKP